jgi:hypothetical protein
MLNWGNVGSESMNNDWQDGKLVLSLRVIGGSGYPDRLLLQPLGVSATGPGPNIVMPGAGRTDLRDIGREGVRIGFGQVEVTGPRVRVLLDELVGSHPDIDMDYHPGAEGIVVMDVRSEVRDGLLGVFRDHTYERAGNLLADLRGLLDSPDGPMLIAAVCDVHVVPEICPFQH